MKREIIIMAISILAEAGAGFLIFTLYALRTSGDYLTGVILSGIVAFMAGLLVSAVLEVNLVQAHKKSPRAATRKAQQFRG